MKYSNNFQPLKTGRKLKSIIQVISMVSCFLLSSCEKELDIQTDFPFELEFMPVPKNIVAEHTVTIKGHIKKDGHYKGTKYYIRYFQFEGKGILMFPDFKPFLPNVTYPLGREDFILLYQPKSKESHEFQVWIIDNFGNERTAEFSFN